MQVNILQSVKTVHACVCAYVSVCGRLDDLARLPVCFKLPVWPERTLCLASSTTKTLENPLLDFYPRRPLAS